MHLQTRKHIENFLAKIEEKLMTNNKYKSLNKLKYFKEEIDNVIKQECIGTKYFAKKINLEQQKNAILARLNDFNVIFSNENGNGIICRIDKGKEEMEYFSRNCLIRNGRNRFSSEEKDIFTNHSNFDKWNVGANGNVIRGIQWVKTKRNEDICENSKMTDSSVEDAKIAKWNIKEENVIVDEEPPIVVLVKRLKKLFTVENLVRFEKFGVIE
ncbi:hypothetical protein MHBO_001466 [Bonamia ostreae]|uniref:Uncharacterized protein n=1 Tax=Bonamia ostreae TaxID=126728 RepID=A0ABV2AJ70_9EUKA